VFRDNALVINSCESPASCKNHFSLRFILHGFHPHGVAVDVVEEHLVFVAAAGACWELACLVGVDGGFGLVNCDVNVVLF
jgi:hypothetical protein